MGTPHKEISKGFDRLVSKIAFISETADDKTVKDLERYSELLQQQLVQYGLQYSLISRDFITKFAYETYPTQVALGKKTVVSKVRYVFTRY